MVTCFRNEKNIKLDDSDKIIIRQEENTITQIYNNIWPLVSIALGITIIVLLIIAIKKALKASDCDSSCSESSCDEYM